jgi:creatinine amidohydrolase
MRFDELNWMDVEEYLKHDQRILVVVGSCEQHGYLSLLTDVKIPMALADAASQQTNVLVAPPLNFGIAPYFLRYPGTISLHTTTFLAVVEDIVHSLYTTGFRHFVFLNGHGGNEPARNVLVEMMNELPDMRTAWYSWWTAHSVEEVAARHGLKPSHANWLEDFPFTRVGPLPEGQKNGVPAFRGIANASMTREIYGDGVFGGTYQSSPSVMQDIFDAALKDILYLLSVEPAR